jgi:hypothetical protein
MVMSLIIRAARIQDGRHSKFDLLHTAPTDFELSLLSTSLALFRAKDSNSIHISPIYSLLASSPVQAWPFLGPRIPIQFTALLFIRS